MTARTLVIGVGNPDRGDDGIGPLVARRLAARLPPDIEVLERRGDALALLDDWADATTVILIDAAARFTAPGRIHRIDPEVEPLPPGLSPTSTHGFGVSDAIALACALGRLPPRLVIYAVEGECFMPGAAMTADVADAVDELTARVSRELREMLTALQAASA